MNKTLAAVMAAGTILAGVAAASPALAAQGSDTQLCTIADNGGTMVNGVCVLPVMTQGQPAEDILANSSGAVDTWTIVSGSLPPGTRMPAQYGAGNTIIGGTPTQRGTFTFTVKNAAFAAVNPPTSQLTYSITVNPARSGGR